MISKRWLPPTRNLFAQMMRSLARTQAAAVTAELPGGGGEEEPDEPARSDESARSADAQPADDRPEDARPDDEEHPDLKALIAVAEMAGLKESLLRKAWLAGIEEGRELSAVGSAGLDVPSVAPVARAAGVAGVCAYPGCDVPAKVRGYCVRHYRRLRYAEARRSQGLYYRPRTESGERRGNGSQSRKPSIPGYTLEILREIGAPLTIDRVCELVRERATDLELPESRVLRARVRHFLYTSPKTERAGRGTFQIKGGAKRVLRRPGGGPRQGEETGEHQG